VFNLQNDGLRVEVIDPIDDRERLGPRFCWGGYIWQVHDRVAGPLLTGPEWPNPAPSAFNGQGLPESFRHHTLDGQPLTWRGEEGVALGAGQLRREHQGEVQVITPCTWAVTSTRHRIEFTTTQAIAGFEYALIRRVELVGREVLSSTRLINASKRDALTLEWFAHPFFALVEGAVRAELSARATLAENPGFTVAHGLLTQKRRFAAVNDGHMDRGLRLPDNEPFRAIIAHPRISPLHFETSFVPSACVIWGNDRTFSFEPYLALTLAPGEAREWSLRYRFGASSGISPSNTSSRLPAER
jgi:hypothetical protein